MSKKSWIFYHCKYFRSLLQNHAYQLAYVSLMLTTQRGNTSQLKSLQHGKLANVLFSTLLNPLSWNLGNYQLKNPTKKKKKTTYKTQVDSHCPIRLAWTAVRKSIQRIPWGRYCWLYITFTCCLSEQRRAVEGGKTRQRTVSFLPTQLRAKEREMYIKGLPDSRAGGQQSNCHCVSGEWGRKNQQKLRKIHLPEERDYSDKQSIYIQLRFSAKEREAMEMDNKHRRICQQHIWNQKG